MSIFTKRLLAGLFYFLFLTAIAFAESISINFVGGRVNPCCGGGGAASVTGAAGFSTSSNWNNFSGNNGSGLSLVDSTGASSGAELAYDGPNNWAAVDATPGGGTDSDMMSGYLDNMGGRTITVSGLGSIYTANGYDVLVFMSSDSAGTPGFSLGGVTYYGKQDAAGLNYPLSGGTNGYVTSSETVKGSAPSANAILFSGITSSSFTITGAAGGGGDRARPNGVQIISIEVPGLADVENNGASFVTSTSAQLNGTITDVGDAAPAVTIYYGETDGVANSGNWAQSVMLPGTQSGTFSQVVTNLAPGTLYYYRARATNSAGDAWALSSQSFETPAILPIVENSAATDITAGRARVGAMVTETGGDLPSVTVHYGTDDAGTNSWQYTASLGVVAESATIELSGLDATTLYYYRVFATNSAGGAWADVSASFTTATPTSAMVENRAASGITSTSANLRGEVTDTGFDTPVVTIHYGYADAGTDSNAWANSVVLGQREGNFTTFVSGLAPDAILYYRASAVNQAGLVWAEESEMFTTAPLNSAHILINEIHYHPLGIDPLEFVELYNPGEQAEDLSGWTLTNAVDFTFPQGTMLGSGDFLVIAGNPVTVSNTYGIAVLGPFTGKLSNDGEKIELRDATGGTVDDVSYGVGFPWPTAADGAGASIELIHPSLDSDLAGSWRSSTPLGTVSPGEENTVFATNAPPQIRQVDHSSNEPRSGENVLITARVTDPDGVDSVSVAYQIVEPGSYIRRTDAAYENPANWTTLSMNDLAVDGDAAAGDFTFTATIPSAVQTHRRLIRYRITVADTIGNQLQVPYADDEQPNFAYFVYDGAPAWTGANEPGVSPTVTYEAELFDDLATYHLIANSTDVFNSQYVGASDGVHMAGTMVYDGKVYDHVDFENRGEASTYQSGKNKWRFHFNRARDFAARDNWGEKYTFPFDELNLDGCSSPWAPVHRGMAGLDEAVSYRMYELAGTPSPRTHYVHFRVVDGASEAPVDQYAGDLWGLYLSVEHPDGSFLDERDLPDGNVYKIEGGNGDKKHQGELQSLDASDWNTFRTNSGGGQTSESYWRNNMDLFAYYTFRAGNRINGNVDVRYGANHLFHHNPERGWTVMPWDLDMMFIAETHWSGAIQQEALLSVPALGIEYRNRAREMFDLFCADNSASGGQMAQLIDEYAQIVNPTGQARTWADIDQFMWNYHPRTRGNPAVHSGQGNHKGNFYYTPFGDQRIGGNYTRTLVSPDHEGFVNYLVDYTTDTFGGGAWSVGNGQQDGYGYEFVKSDANDPNIPDTPVLTYTGAGGFPSDNLVFTNTPFSDPNGSGFAAIQWRVGEISNPSMPLYDVTKPYIYEIEAHWTSGELTTYSSTVTIPPNTVRVGHTYRLRVKMLDDTGRWSHWSDPVEFVVGEPDLSPWQNDLMITEVMYHPSETTHAEREAGFTSGDFEYMELQNVGTNMLDLSELRFTKGVDFDFVGGAITNLAPGAYVLVVSDPAAFAFRYGAGLPVAGSYAPDQLSNSGENVKLSFALGSAVHEFTYIDEAPWPGAADGYGPSMELVSPTNRPDHAIAANWQASAGNGSPGSANIGTTFSGPPGADNDNDGLAALLEFALGTSDAVTNQVSDVYTYAVENFDGTDYATFTYRRNLAARDIGIIVEISKDLVIWETAPERLLEREVLSGGNTSLVTWRSRNPFDTVCYYRLRIVQF